MHAAKERGRGQFTPGWSSSWSTTTSVRVLVAGLLQGHPGRCPQSRPVNPGWPLVAAMLQLGRTPGLQVIAEGVEDGDQLAELAELACPYVLGYHLARPAPVAR